MALRAIQNVKVTHILCDSALWIRCSDSDPEKLKGSIRFEMSKKADTAVLTIFFALSFRKGKNINPG